MTRQLALDAAQQAANRPLLAMLATCRPHGSQAEHDFIERFLLPLGVEADGFGNLWLDVGPATILWSSHVDTCHRKGGTQKLALDAAGQIRLAAGSPSNCLGADCTAGVWLMTEMIAAGVPGRYVFHRGEERGGLGSRYVASTEPQRLAGLDAAIAFDRRGTTSIITHQGDERGCSDRFATSLAAILDLGHSLDPTGSFTDTANYTGHVGECTNLSVGYAAEHTPAESLDILYLLRLRDALLAADFTQLAFGRRPGEADPDLYSAYEFGFTDRRASALGGSARLYDLVRDYPAAVADYLNMCGVSADDLADFMANDIPF